jgi:tRNA pseudouridine38-40 synthase
VDIAVRTVERAPESFHARHDAVGKTYLYQISRRRTAFGKRYVWWLKDQLDILRMREASAAFLGMKDLRAFTDDDPEEKSTKVLIEDLRVSESGDLIIIRIDGSHFLWKSVRRITGILVEVGRGSLSPADVLGLLGSSSRGAARFTAPPSGLFLARVYYKGMTRPKTIHPLLNVPHE